MFTNAIKPFNQQFGPYPSDYQLIKFKRSICKWCNLTFNDKGANIQKQTKNVYVASGKYKIINFEAQKVEHNI